MCGYGSGAPGSCLLVRRRLDARTTLPALRCQQRLLEPALVQEPERVVVEVPRAADEDALSKVGMGGWMQERSWRRGVGGYNNA